MNEAQKKLVLKAVNALSDDLSYLQKRVGLITPETLEDEKKAINHSIANIRQGTFYIKVAIDIKQK